jgi:protoheme IX farnesyltransferase
VNTTAHRLVAAPVIEKSSLSVWCDLVKARLTLLVLFTTLVGFYMGTAGDVDWTLMLHSLSGIGLLACGAAALNQLLERELDAKMRRTRDRPLPSGRLQPETVLVFGAASSLAGLVWLAVAANPLTSAVGALTLVSYLFVYTPLKRVTWMNTLVGAIPGGLPPLLGWTAARGGLGEDGWGLFAILFFWQIPHFLAIAWLYRDEYAKAGFVMLPTVDPLGGRTGRQAVGYALALWVATLLPALGGLVGTFYLVSALASGLAFVAMAVRFARSLTVARARQLFLASILYLPALLGLMVWDKVKL